MDAQFSLSSPPHFSRSLSQYPRSIAAAAQGQKKSATLKKLPVDPDYLHLETSRRNKNTERWTEESKRRAFFERLC
jgi:hypothetical protein